jgi:sigma-B regulation protein RsbU (phosphoserine phosphatase)
VHDDSPRPGHDPFESLYDRAPCGFLSMAPDGTILTANQTFLDWTGYDRETIIGGRSFSQLLTAGGRIYHETHYAPTLQMQGMAREIAFDIVCHDGRRLPVLVNSTLDRDEAGAPMGIRAAVFDATERRQYERELLAAKQRAEESSAHARLLVRTLQQTLLPPELPRIRGLDVAAVYRPAGTGDEIGGDFYDVFQVGADDWMVAIGDVQGKGVGAAVVTALARYTIRAAAVEHEDPSAVLHVLNDVLLHYDTDRFCTAIVLRLRFRHSVGRWRATVSCGGHPLPLLATAGRPPVEIGRTGKILGFFTDAKFYDVNVDLTPDDTITLFTDGLSEARGTGSFFGEQRVRDLVHQADGTASDRADVLAGEALAFQHDAPRDDIAIVVIRTLQPLEGR